MLYSISLERAVLAARAGQHTTRLVAPQGRASVRCRYTSLPERMGEQADTPAAAAAEPALSGRHMSYIHESFDEGVKHHRSSDEADQQRVMGLLHEIESAAVATNKEAGHPELHRVEAPDYLDADQHNSAATAADTDRM